MKMNWEISWADMCRACMGVEGVLVSLYDDSIEKNENNLPSKLTEVTSVEINKSDGLPTKICESCAHRTNAFFEFKCLVQESDVKLRNMFNSQIISDEESEDKKTIYFNDEVENYNPNMKESSNTDNTECEFTAIIEPTTENVDVPANVEIFDKVCNTVILNMVQNSNDTSHANNEINQLHLVFHPDDFRTINNINNSQIFEDASNCRIEQVILSSTIESTESKDLEDGNINDSLQVSSELVEELLKENQILEKSKLDVNNTDLNNSDSDVGNLQENIVGSLNDTITKVKEIKEAGKVVQYQCTLCLQNYEILADVLSHIVDLHVPNTGPFYCVVCEKDCDSLKELRAHIKVHRGPNPYTCFLCNKGYVMKRYLKRHMVCHTDFPRHRCSKCGERFKVKSELEIHIKSHSKGAPFKCSQCPRVFNHKGNYKRHLIFHLDPKGIHLPKYPCSVCNRRFLNNRTLITHMRVHTGEKPYQCDICNKSFSQQGNLLNHLKIHTNPRSFTCEVCGKSFNQKATLRDHSLLHSGEKPYVCTICGSAFTFSAALRRHIWTHNEGKPYECDVCSAKFIGRYDLKRHMKVHNKKPKAKRNKNAKVKVSNTTEISENTVNTVENTLDPNTIFVEQIFLCDDSIQIISPEDSEKENVDSLLGLIQYS